MQRLAFEGLELSDGKLSRSVLRELGASNGPRLPGLFILSIYLHMGDIWVSAKIYSIPRILIIMLSCNPQFSNVWINGGFDLFRASKRIFTCQE